MDHDNSERRARSSSATEGKSRIEHAAALLQVPLSDFVRSAVEDRAEQIVAEHETFTRVPATFYDELFAALDAG